MICLPLRSPGSLGGICLTGLRTGGARPVVRQRQEPRERHDERRSEAQAGALDAYRPSVEFHDLRNDGQTDSQSWPVTGRLVRLPIQLEDVRCEVGADAGTGIDDRQSGVISPRKQFKVCTEVGRSI